MAYVVEVAESLQHPSTSKMDKNIIQVLKLIHGNRHSQYLWVGCWGGNLIYIVPKYFDIKFEYVLDSLQIYAMSANVKAESKMDHFVSWPLRKISETHSFFLRSSQVTKLEFMGMTLNQINSLHSGRIQYHCTQRKPDKCSSWNVWYVFLSLI